MNTNFNYQLIPIEFNNWANFKDYTDLRIAEKTGLDTVTKNVLREKTMLPMHMIEDKLVVNGHQLALAVDRDVIERSMDKDCFIHACFSVDNEGRIIVFMPSDYSESGIDEYYSVVEKYL